ncbi:MAG: PKD domain-containing protein [bacterium]|nr:PKD domain-containing protein [bacterium]
MSDSTKSCHVARTVFIALMIHVLVGISSEAAVVANFTFSPASPQAGQPVQFTDTSTGNPTHWQWDFENPPNGTDSTLQNPTWTFDAPGTYAVRFIALTPPIDIDEVVEDIVVGNGEPCELRFCTSDYMVGEGAGISWIAVCRTGDPDGAASVRCNTADGTATAGQDYMATTVTLVWAHGDNAMKVCTIPIVDDSTGEGNETIIISLSNCTGCVCEFPNTTTLTILEDGVPLLPAGVVLRVLRNARIDCDSVQLAPAVESSGSLRLKFPASDTFHLHLSEEGEVVLDREVSARAGEVIEIVGLGLAPYELEITAEKRIPIRFSMELTAASPCAALEIDP